jgi:hypothetical protein
LLDAGTHGGSAADGMAGKVFGGRSYLLRSYVPVSFPVLAPARPFPGDHSHVHEIALVPLTAALAVIKIRTPVQI